MCKWALNCILIRLHHSQEGSTYPGYKWMCFVYISHCFHEEQNALAFNLVSCKIFEHFVLQVDPVIEFIQLGSTPFKDSAKMVLSLNGVDLSCMNSITGSTCRAKCSNILHDTGRMAPSSGMFTDDASPYEILGTINSS